MDDAIYEEAYYRLRKLVQKYGAKVGLERMDEWWQLQLNHESEAAQEATQGPEAANEFQRIAAEREAALNAAGRHDPGKRAAIYAKACQVLKEALRTLPDTQSVMMAMDIFWTHNDPDHLYRQQAPPEMPISADEQAYKRLRLFQLTHSPQDALHLMQQWEQDSIAYLPPQQDIAGSKLASPRTMVEPARSRTHAELVQMLISACLGLEAKGEWPTEELRSWWHEHRPEAQDYLRKTALAKLTADERAILGA